MTRLYLSLLVASLTMHSPGMAEQHTVRSDKGETSITYHLIHPLHKIEATSKEVDCLLTMDPETREIIQVTARVDVMTFDSGNSNRDSHAMEVVDALTYPEVTFTSTAIKREAGDSIRVNGKLTFHGVTRDVVLPATLQWSENRLVVNGSLKTSLTAFKIEPPSLLLIPVQDELDFSIVGVFVWGEKSPG